MIRNFQYCNHSDLCNLMREIMNQKNKPAQQAGSVNSDETTVLVPTVTPEHQWNFFKTPSNKSRNMVAIALTIAPLVIFSTLLALKGGDVMLTTGNNQTSCDALAPLNGTSVWPDNATQPHWLVNNLTAVCNYLEYLRKPFSGSSDTESYCSNLLISPKSPVDLPDDLSSQFVGLMYYCSKGIFSNPGYMLATVIGLWVLAISAFSYLIARCCIGENRGPNDGADAALQAATFALAMSW